MHPMLNIAARAARKAGNLIIKYFEHPKDSNNVVNNIIKINKAAETIIVETIRGSYPQHTIFTEKISGGKSVNQDEKCQWIIEPLDGISNFAKRFPYFAVSIAVRIKSRTEVAVVYDPMRNELFTATRGHGTQLNGYRLRSSNARKLNGTILVTDFSFKKKQYISAYINILRKLFSVHSDFRRTGSVSLDLSYVAAGRFDGYFKIGLKPFYFAAGELIAREAGAIICDFDGDYNYLMNENIIVGNPRIVKLLLTNIHNKQNEVFIR